MKRITISYRVAVRATLEPIDNVYEHFNLISALSIAFENRGVTLVNACQMRGKKE